MFISPPPVPRPKMKIFGSRSQKQKTAPQGDSFSNYSDIDGLALQLLTTDTTTLLADGGAQFTAANKEHADITDAAQDGAYDHSTGDYSVWGHFYRDSTGQQTIYSKRQDASNYELLEIDASNNLHYIAVIGGATKVEVTGTTAITTTATWYSYALVVDRDSAGDTEFYLDASVDTSGTPTVSTDNIDNTGDVEWGVNNASNYWNGRMDTTLLCNAKLTAAEITALHDSGSGVTTEEVEAGAGDLSTVWAKVTAAYDWGEGDGEQRLDSKGTNHLTAVGDELVVNGGFDSDTEWTKGTGWSIAAGVADSDGSQVADSDLSDASIVTSGTTYTTVVTTANRTVGNLTVVLGTQEGTDRAGNDTYTEDITANGTGIALRADLDWDGDADNFSIKVTSPVTRVAGIAAGSAMDVNLAALFNGTNQSLSHADDSNLDMDTGDFTIEVWVRPDTEIPSLQNLLNKYQNASNNYYLRLTGTTKVPYFFANIGGVNKIIVDSTTGIATDSWNHIVVVVDRDSSANTKIYLNGIDTTSGTPTVSTDTIANSGAFEIAEYAGVSNYSGRMDSLRIWKGTALSSANITSLFNGGKGVKHADIPAGITAPTVSFDMEDLTDAAGTITDLTNNNTVTFTSEGVAYIEGLLSTFQDQHTSNNDFTQTEIAKRPQVHSNIFGIHPGILTDGVDDVINTVISEISGVNKVSLFILAKRVAAGDIVSASAADAGNEAFGINMWSDSKTYFNVRNGDASSHGSFSDGNTTDATIMSLIYDGTQSTDAVKLIGRLNGVQQSLTFGATIPATLPTLTNKFGIGSFETGPTYGEAYYGAIIMYTTALTATQADDVESKIESDFGLSVL